MLKIVDYYPNTKIPFPLKELEKFGFKEIKYSNTDYLIEMRKEESDYITFCVAPDRIIYLMTKKVRTTFPIDIELETLFELSKADLVEKIDE